MSGIIRSLVAGTALLVLLADAGNAAPFKLTVFHTNTTNGVLQGCSCPRGGDGGLDRRMTVLRQERASAPNSLLLDSGDMFPVMPDSAKSSMVLRIMQDMGYDLVGIGDQEFTNGLAFIRRQVDAGELPFISANIQFVDGDRQVYPLTQPYRIVERGGRRIGLVGITCNDAFKFVPGKQKKDLVIGDVDAALKPVLAHMERERVTILILVSHCGIANDRKLAVQYPQFDVIVGGHSQTQLDTPEKVGNTLIVQAGSDGGRLGRLDLTFDADGNVTAYDGKLLRLTREVAGDESVIGLIKEFNKSRSKNRFWR